MKISIKKIFYRLVLFSNITCVILLLLAVLAPYLNPSTWWPIALMGIIFPILIVIAICFIVFWLFIQPKKSLITLIPLVFCIPNIISSFGFNFASSFNQTKEKDNIRILTWNVGLMNYTALDSNEAITNNAIILKKLKESDADVICLQEFFTAVIPGNHYNFIDSIKKTLHYPYHYFSLDYPKFEGSFYSGTIIFSKYNIIDTHKIIFPKPFAGSVIKASLQILNDTIDIVTTRLQSVNFKSNQYKELSNIKHGGDSAFSGSKDIIQKLRLGYAQRIEQVKIVKSVIEKSNRPLIFTGDLNDVPVSYSYSSIKQNLHDSWIKKGTGLGRTFIYISPTLRIDHIFFNDSFSVKQTKRIFAEDGSDHHAIVSDLVLKNKEHY